MTVFFLLFDGKFVVAHRSLDELGPEALGHLCHANDAVESDTPEQLEEVDDGHRCPTSLVVDALLSGTGKDGLRVRILCPVCHAEGCLAVTDGVDHIKRLEIVFGLQGHEAAEPDDGLKKRHACIA